MRNPQLSQGTPNAQHPTPNIQSGKAGAPRILIVDDDPGQRSLLNSFLRSQGFDTVVVDSGERALTALRDHEIAMMISDVRMPGISGLDGEGRGNTFLIHISG